MYLFMEKITSLITHEFINVSNGTKEIYLKYKIGNLSNHHVIYSAFDVEKFKKIKNHTLLVASSPGKYIWSDDIIASIAKIHAPKVEITITFLLSYLSESFPIGYCEMAPETASRKVTSDIWNIVKFIDAAYTANNVNSAA